MSFKESFFDKLQDWLQDGSKENLSEEENEYFNALYAILGVYRKYGRTNTINFAMRKLGVDRKCANRLFSESMNLFFVDDTVTNKAWRNIIFNMQMELHLVLKKTAKNVDDIEVASRILERAAKVKKIDEPDSKKVENSQVKFLKVYSLSAKDIGIPEINRDIIARQIDEMDIEEADKERIKTDAGLKEFNLEKIIDDQENQIEDFEG